MSASTARGLRRSSLRPWSRWIAPRPPSPETVFVTTDDDVRLAIHRVHPGGAFLDSRGRPQPSPAVVLLHGLGANATGFLLPQRSLAGHLASKGFDVYVPELRGAGESETPELRWDLDDYLDRDLPAILDAVRRASGRRTVHWLGHSMGGVLLCCYAIRHADHGIRSGIAVGSALDYTRGESEFARLFALRRVIERIPVIPFGAFSHLVAPLLGRVRNPFEAFNFWPGNVEPELVRAIYAHAFEGIPVSLLRSLGTTFEPGGLRSRDGSLRYVECASKFTAPLLLVSGSADVQCPPKAVEATARLIGPHARALHFGTTHGHAGEYGHFDLLVGRRAPDEVWPRLEAFLRETAAAQA